MWHKTSNIFKKCTTNYLKSLITRNVRGSVRPIIEKQKIDPGIRKQSALLEGDVELDALEEHLESDFMNVGLSHREHSKEMSKYKVNLQHDIIKQKYFKESYPNFLTWSDKKQIQFLHNSDPEEWSIEKLSEGFPALPATIVVSIFSG